MSEVFGRTNLVLPRVWWGLRSGFRDEEEGLVESVLATGAPVEVSGSAGKWGRWLAGAANPVVVVGGRSVEGASSEKLAADWVAMDLVSLVSALGRGRVDFFYLEVRRALDEHQVNGALATLEDAKQDGLVGHIGLCVSGPALAVAGMWRFHDAFETVMARRGPGEAGDFAAVLGTARERRAGVVATGVFDWGLGLPFFEMPGLGWEAGARRLGAAARESSVCVGVRSAGEVAACLAAVEGGGEWDWSREAGLWDRYRSSAGWLGSEFGERAWLTRAREQAYGF